MSEASKTPAIPKSIRHKRILDVAAEQPDATVDAIASEIPSVTADLVERVLDQYGDPADTTDTPIPGDKSPATNVTVEDATASTESTDSTGASGDHSDDDTDATTAEDTTTEDETTAAGDTADTSEPGDESAAADADTNGDDDPDEDAATAGTTEQAYAPSPDDLTQKERETLRVIHENPTATQREIAAELDVATATVSNRVNGIDGFDWSERASFATAVFDADTSATPNPEGDQSAVRTDGASDTETTPTESTEEMSTTDTTDADEPAAAALADRLDRLDDRLAAIETRLEDSDATTAFDDPELIHKVVHACMESDSISEEEELRILRDLLS